MFLPQAVTKQDPVPVSPADIRAKMNSATVQQNVNLYRQKLAQGASPDDPQMKEMKLNLPMLFCAQGLKNIGGGRRNNLIPSLAIAIDLDGITTENPREIYTTHIAPRIKELKIGMVQVTIKGHGLHIWADRLPHESIPQAQQRIAKALGLERYLDTVCSDLGRGIFLTTPQDLLYMDDDFFYMTPEEAQQAALLDDYKNNTNIKKTMINQIQTLPAPAGTVAYMPQPKTYNIQTDYQGAKLRDIVDEFIRLDMPNGILYGQRNNNLFKIFVNLGQICQPLAAREATQHLTGIDRSDIDSTLASAYRTIDNGQATMCPRFRQAISNAVAESKFAKEEAEGEADDTTQSSSLSLPSYPLPPILCLAVKNLPQPFVVPTLMLAKPVLGALLSDVSFSYWFDGNTHHFAFLALVLAEQSAGKSSVIYPRLQMLAKPLYEEDQQAEEAWDRYDMALDRLKPGDDFPQKPAEALRITPTDITSAAFFTVLGRANNKTALLIDDEANAFFRTGGGEQYRMTKEIVKKAYDQAIYKMARKGGEKFNGPVRLNMALLGTPGVLQNFTTAGEGDLGRFTFASIEGLSLHQPRITPLSPEEQQRIAALAQALTRLSGHRFAPWIDVEAKKYRDELEDRYITTCDQALPFIFHRIVVDFTRTAYMFSVLYGCDQTEWNEQPRLEDEEKRKACLAWAKYLAEYSLSQTLRFCRKQFELCAGELPPQVDCPDLFEPLPDTFTTQELADICVKMNHYKGNHQKVLSLWKRNLWIENVKNERGAIQRGQFRKIKKTN